MAELSGESVLRAGGKASRLRGVPLGEPLAGHAYAVRWGAWAEVGGRPVLATGGSGVGGIGGTVRLWDGLDGVPLGEPLAGHAGAVLWGAWAEVGGRPVLDPRLACLRHEPGSGWLRLLSRWRGFRIRRR